MATYEDKAEWAAAVEKGMTKPTAYVATQDGYDNAGGKIVKEGETFVTTAAPGTWMEPVDKAEKPVAKTANSATR